jgi:predicted DNA-binding ribbon-helix-helix protein
MTRDVDRTTLTLPTHLMDKLKAVANERGQTVSSLIGNWVYELPEPRLTRKEKEE